MIFQNSLKFHSPLRIPISKYHSWYLCQISLQLMLLPTLIALHNNWAKRSVQYVMPRKFQTCSLSLRRWIVSLLCQIVAVSLCRRHKLTPVSNVYEAAPIFLFKALNGLNELPEVSFESPLNLIGKSTMAFLTGQSWPVLKSWYTGGHPELGFWRCFADGLNQSLVSFVLQAR